MINKFKENMTRECNWSSNIKITIHSEVLRQIRKRTKANLPWKVEERIRFSSLLKTQIQHLSSGIPEGYLPRSSNKSTPIRASKTVRFQPSPIIQFGWKKSKIRYRFIKLTEPTLTTWGHRQQRVRRQPRQRRRGLQNPHRGGHHQRRSHWSFWLHQG